MMSRGGMKYGFIWVLLLAVVLVQAYQLDACLEEERLGLLKIKAYMNSVIIDTTNSYIDLPWSDNGGKENCCAWDRVTCNSPAGRVTKMDLSSMIMMRGESYYVPDPWVLNLTVFSPFKQLIGLNLSYTSCSGLVEADGTTNVSTLKNLQSLSLHDGYLGAASISFGALTSLKQLDLGNCQLNDSSFEALGLEKKKDMQLLDLSGNNIQSPELFTKLANLTELQVLDISYNPVQGFVTELLPKIAILTKLRVLDLSKISLRGSMKGICNSRNLHELHLSDNGLSGSLPSCLSNLTSLQVLDVSENHLSGEVPKMLPHLTSLQHFDLSYNNIKGKLSLSSLANLSRLEVLRIAENDQLEVQTEDSSWQPTFQLRTLDLSSCNLNKPHGTIPEFLTHQYHLSYIDLSNSNLVEGFPTWLLNNNPLLPDLHLHNNALKGCLQLPPDANFSLSLLDISNNNFRGRLPENFGLAFSQLQHLFMDGNHFEGNMPASVAHMSKIEYLFLQGNNFSGELPKRLLSDCQAIVDLNLSDNNLQGEIIPDHMNLPSLKSLVLRNNNFGGTIKEALKNSTTLWYLDISNNKVTGRIPRWIGSLHQLWFMSMSDNLLEGKIPTNVCNLYSLGYLDLSKNNLIGHIPSCSYVRLNILNLHNNSLTGPIPPNILSSKALKVLDLADNQLLGGIPLWISKLPSLRVLLLAGNDLGGPIPHQICQLSNVSLLSLSRNQLHGGIPACFVNMSYGLGGAGDIFSNSNKFFGDVFIEFQIKNLYLSYVGIDLNLMSALDLSSNQLTGIIPSELGDMRQIRALNLSHNYLFGIIPNSFANLKKVESLDLSCNNLSGMIPSQLVGLNFLSTFNVSYNNLSGRTPETGQFANFDEYNYLGNPGLCGSRLNKSCNPSNPLPSPTSSSSCKEGADDAAGIDMEDFLWSFGMSSVVAFLTVIVVLWINPQWRGAWFDFAEWHILWWLPLP